MTDTEGTQQPSATRRSEPRSTARPTVLKTRGLALGGLVVGALVALLAATQVWVSARLAIEGLPAVLIEPTGRTLVPLVPAVALLGLGAAVALLLVGRIGRGLIAILVVLLAVAAAVAAVRVSADPVAAVSASLAEAAGVSALPQGSDAVTATVTLWPVLAAVGLAILALAAAVAGVAPTSVWGSSGRRYATSTSTSAASSSSSSSSSMAASESADAASPRDDGVGLWDALDRGDDPTA